MSLDPDQLKRELSVRAHRLIERGSKSVSLQDRIEAHRLLIDELYIIMWNGGLDIERWPDGGWVYSEDHRLETTVCGTPEDMEWALAVMRQYMVLDDLSAI